MQLLNRILFITGGARGLGKGFAETALKAGAKGVVLIDNNAESGHQTAVEFSSKYGSNKTLFAHCDITEKHHLERIFQEAVELFGNIDIVVNNAGISSTGGNFEKIIDTNLTALTRSTYLAVEHMRTDKGGKGGLIVNMSSIAGLGAAQLQPVYAASKHGVVGLSRSLAIAVDPLGIKVTCICPGYVRTEMVMDAVYRTGTAEEIKMKKQMVADLGMLEISDVQKAFQQLVEDEIPGAVMVVTLKRGIGYKYPKTLKNTAKL